MINLVFIYLIHYYLLIKIINLKFSFYYFYFLRQGFSVYPGCPRTLFVDQGGFQLTRDPFASASQMLGPKVCATIPRFINGILIDGVIGKSGVHEGDLIRGSSLRP